MEFSELVRVRESIRSYDPLKPVPRKVIERILEAGRLAPTAANLQPFRFVVVESEEMVRRVHVCYHGAFFKDAPQALVVVGVREQAWVRKPDGYCALETDCTIAMDHMVLAAENEGVGTCWIAGFDNGMLRETLGLVEGEFVYAMTPLGYPKQGFVRKGTKERKPLEELVRFV
jgi:nitroreductase